MQVDLFRGNFLYELDNLTGIAESDDPDFSLEDAINDTPRVEFMHSYLNSLANAMRYFSLCSLTRILITY